MQIWGLDFTENAYHLFTWKPDVEDGLPSAFGTQIRPTFMTIESRKIYRDEDFGLHRCSSFVLIWYARGFGKVQFSNLNHGPLYGSDDGMQLVQKGIEVGHPCRTSELG